jgi:hypothetical protein
MSHPGIPGHWRVSRSLSAKAERVLVISAGWALSVKLEAAKTKGIPRRFATRRELDAQQYSSATAIVSR